ncbi:N-acetylmuramoyl-L-alanine amidase [Nocardiopsis sp. YSL2]|uniref:peptidoglycan recognition protein family protein n=1 Tax=Nocardiopsis sp. YSL2 TaxID=2939492 RepID=UPI0026F41AF8|nr:N-acetylmuramoyl-L-alanine amidase [Nocardiopsis sp. YSL2]
MKLVTRRMWGGPASIGGYANPTRGCVAHYNGGAIGLIKPGKPHAACYDYVRRVHRQHLNQGWAGIGYAFLACPHGYVFEGRGLSHQQAAQPGGNSTWYSIQMMVGGGEQPTDLQIQAWRDCRTYIRQRRAVAAAIRGHYQFVSTSCPGTPTKRLIANGTLAGSGSGTPAPGGGSVTVPHMTTVRPVDEQQKAVNRLGYEPELDVDDVFGPLTLKGVEWLQEELGVTVDGLWGKVTEAAYLKRIGGSAPKPPAKPFPLARGHWFGPPSSDDRNHSGYYWPADRPHIKEIQGKVGAKKDGRYGPKTKAAVTAWQRKAGFTGRAVDGLTGPNTWGRMFG